MLYHCNECDNFDTPADEVGVEIMRAHLEEEHGVPRPVRPRLTVSRAWNEERDRIWWEREQAYIYGYGSAD